MEETLAHVVAEQVIGYLDRPRVVMFKLSLSCSCHFVPEHMVSNLAEAARLNGGIIWYGWREKYSYDEDRVVARGHPVVKLAGDELVTDGVLVDELIEAFGEFSHHWAFSTPEPESVITSVVMACIMPRIDCTCRSLLSSTRANNVRTDNGS